MQDCGELSGSARPAPVQSKAGPPQGTACTGPEEQAPGWHSKILGQNPDLYVLAGSVLRHCHLAEQKYLHGLVLEPRSR